MPWIIKQSKESSTNPTLPVGPIARKGVQGNSPSAAKMSLRSAYTLDQSNGSKHVFFCSKLMLLAQVSLQEIQISFDLSSCKMSFHLKDIFLHRRERHSAWALVARWPPLTPTATSFPFCVFPLQSWNSIVQGISNFSWALLSFGVVLGVLVRKWGGNHLRVLWFFF